MPGQTNTEKQQDINAEEETKKNQHLTQSK
jgi:hypothetical protein